MTSAFSPESFLDATLNEPSVKRPPLPVGDYLGVIGEVKSRPWTGTKDPSKSGMAFDVPVALEIPAEVQAALGLTMATLNLKDSIMLDLTEAGTIDNSLGKNGHLRKYREALDMNKPGDSFSVRRMQGQVALFKIGHEMYNDEPQERIKGVTRRP